MSRLGESRPQYAPSGFVVGRFPLVSLTDFLEGGGTSGEQGRERARTWLIARLERREVMEALYLASPSLCERIATWRESPDSKKGRGVEVALTKYLSRMAGRCTPFGTCAGVALGVVGERTALTLGCTEAYRRVSRLDMGYLSELSEDLARSPAVRAGALLFPNTSLYASGSSVRYAEARQDGGSRTYDLVHAESDGILRAVLERAQGGAKQEELTEVIVACGFSKGEARAYVEELLSAQVLQAAVQPCLVGSDALSTLIRDTAPLDPVTADVLESVQTDLADIDRGGLGADASRYRRAARRLAVLPPRTKASRLFQVDMFVRADDLAISRSVADRLLGAVDVLRRIFGESGGAAMRSFAADFARRYGERHVPVLEALDPDSGVPFGGDDVFDRLETPLLDGLGLGAPLGSSDAEAWTSRTDWLVRRLIRAARARADEIEIEDADLPFSGTVGDPLPDAFSLMTSLYEGDSPGRPLAVLNGLQGPSGVRLLARFCHADEELLRAVREHTRQEEALLPDVLFAEVVHQPDGRVGNILARPHLRDWNLDFLGRSSGPGRRLKVGDLTVSVERNEVVLRTRSSGQRVLPRITTAHNTNHRSVPLYRFLASLQVQGVQSGLAWRWGRLDRQEYLPRVTWNDVVLARATWNLSGVRVSDGLGGESDAARSEAVRRWRAEYRLPRLVGLVENDNILPLDLENPLCLDVLTSLSRRRPWLRLQELLPRGRAPIATGPTGRFCNELVVPYVRKRRTETERPKKSMGGRAGEGVRRFGPGSEWLFVSLYMSRRDMDRVLRECVVEVLRKAGEAGDVSRWFFVRYGDPEPHLRIRARGRPERLLETVLPRLRAALSRWTEDGRIWRVIVDTYEPETERYGGEQGLEACEELFHADSVATCDFLGRVEGGDPVVRWKFALRAMHDWMAAVWEREGRHRQIARIATTFRAEFDVRASRSKALSRLYRKDRPEVAAIAEGDVAGLPEACWEVLERRARSCAEPLGRLVAAAASGAPSVGSVERDGCASAHARESGVRTAGAGSGDGPVSLPGATVCFRTRSRAGAYVMARGSLFAASRSLVVGAEARLSELGVMEGTCWTLDGVRMAATFLHDSPLRVDLESEDRRRSIVVRVEAFSCNYRDKIQPLALGTGHGVGWHYIGSDFVGEVVAVGSDVSELQVGDRVIPNGAYGPDCMDEGRPGLATSQASRTLLVIPAGRVVPIPKEMGDLEAAAFSVGAQTTMAMARRAAARDGERALVLSAQSNTSLFAVQVLAARGVEVCGVSGSERGRELLASLGVRHQFVVPWGESPLQNTDLRAWIEAVGGMDVVIDPFADLNGRYAPLLLRNGGRYVTCGVLNQGQPMSASERRPAGVEESNFWRSVVVGNVSLLGSCLGTREDLVGGLEEWKCGRLRPVLDSHFAGTDASAFLERTFVDRERLGKVVFRYDRAPAGRQVNERVRH